MIYKQTCMYSTSCIYLKKNQNDNVGSNYIVLHTISKYTMYTYTED